MKKSINQKKHTKYIVKMRQIYCMDEMKYTHIHTHTHAVENKKKKLYVFLNCCWKLICDKKFISIENMLKVKWTNDETREKKAHRKKTHSSIKYNVLHKKKNHKI